MNLAPKPEHSRSDGKRHLNLKSEIRRRRIAALQRVQEQRFGSPCFLMRTEIAVGICV